MALLDRLKNNHKFFENYEGDVNDFLVDKYQRPKYLQNLFKENIWRYYYYCSDV